jgi:replicative DNA helicase
MPKDRPNRLHQRLARKIAEEKGIPYQQALIQVQSVIKEPTIGDLKPDIADGCPTKREPFIELGYPELDHVLHIQKGKFRGQTMLLASAAGTGKTRWLLDVVFNHAQKDKNSLFISLDMPQKTIYKSLSDRDANSRVSENIHIWTPTFSKADINQIEQLIIENKEQHQVSLVCIDPLELLFSSNESIENQRQQICSELSHIAQKHQVMIIVTMNYRKGERGRGLSTLLPGSFRYTDFFDYICEISLDKNPDLSWEFSLNKNRHGETVQFRLPWSK